MSLPVSSSAIMRELGLLDGCVAVSVVEVKSLVIAVVLISVVAAVVLITVVVVVVLGVVVVVPGVILGAEKDE